MKVSKCLTSQPKLIVSVSVYNEQDNIEDMLHSLQQISDIDVVYILDGRYLDDGNPTHESIHSTDMTASIVQNSKIGLFEKKWIHAQEWKSESHKRNWLWNFIEEREGDNVWHFVVDADEEIVLPKDVKSIELKPLLKDAEDIVLLESGPHNNDVDYPLEYFQVRLFKACKGIHWATTDVMIYHDKDCNVMMDYGRGLLKVEYSWIKTIQIMNKWFIRAKDDIKIVAAYRKNRKFDEKCIYKK